MDPAGTLIGIVNRRDLLSVFLRPDEELADDVRGLLGQILVADPANPKVVVNGGAVTLTGHVEQPDLIPVATRLTRDIDGVVDVVNELTVPQAG